MGWVWTLGCDTEVAEPTIISLLNQTVSVITSVNLPQRTL